MCIFWFSWVFPVIRTTSEQFLINVRVWCIMLLCSGAKMNGCLIVRWKWVYLPGVCFDSKLMGYGINKWASVSSIFGILIHTNCPCKQYEVEQQCYKLKARTKSISCRIVTKTRLQSNGFCKSITPLAHFGERLVSVPERMGNDRVIAFSHSTNSQLENSCRLSGTSDITSTNKFRVVIWKISWLNGCNRDTNAIVVMWRSTYVPEIFVLTQIYI